MKKVDILNKINDCLSSKRQNRARNSMGVSESFYNPYYLIGKCFDNSGLKNMTEVELNHLITLAEYASEAFY